MLEGVRSSSSKELLAFDLGGSALPITHMDPPPGSPGCREACRRRDRRDASPPIGERGKCYVPTGEPPTVAPLTNDCPRGPVQTLPLYAHRIAEAGGRQAGRSGRAMALVGVSKACDYRFRPMSCIYLRAGNTSERASNLSFNVDPEFRLSSRAQRRKKQLPQPMPLSSIGIASSRLDVHEFDGEDLASMRQLSELPSRRVRNAHQ